VKANAYTDKVKNGPGSYVYQVCAVGSSLCSNKPTVTF
jgi:hypothetical protein